MEAVKWSLKASNFYSFRDSESLAILIKRFTLIEKSHGKKKRAKRFFNTFLELRKSLYVNMVFMLRAPLKILRIHINGIVYKKKLKKS